MKGGPLLSVVVINGVIMGPLSMAKKMREITGVINPAYRSYTP